VVKHRGEPWLGCGKSRGERAVTLHRLVSAELTCCDTRLIVDDDPLPPAAATPEQDDDLLADYPWVDGPIKMDYGYNVRCVPVFRSTYDVRRTLHSRAHDRLTRDAVAS